MGLQEINAHAARLRDAYAAGDFSEDWLRDAQIAYTTELVSSHIDPAWLPSVNDPGFANALLHAWFAGPVDPSSRAGEQLTLL